MIYASRLVRLWLGCVCVLLTLSASRSSCADDAPSFVVRAGRILPVADQMPWQIEDGIIIVRRGVIEWVGPASDVSLPDDLPVLELPDATIVPGFVAASSNLIPPHAGDESISGAYRAVEAFDRFGDYRPILGSGITTVHLDPGRHRLVSGRGAIVRLGGPENERVLRADADLTMSLGESAFNPPNLVEYLIPPSGDQPLRPSRTQRPSSRVGRFLAIRDAIAAAQESDRPFDLHLSTFGEAWRNAIPLRLQAQRAEDIRSAIAFLQNHQRAGYIVGGLEAIDAVDILRTSRVPLVYTMDGSVRTTQRNIGSNPNALVGESNELSTLEGVRLALALTDDQPISDLRLAAAAAMRAGLSEEQVLNAITRTPASILGIDDQVGSISTGRDADFVVMSDRPLATSSHVQRVFVRGRQVFRAESDSSRAVVVRGGTVWLGPNDWMNDGSILIEDGRITAVGRRVPHPPNAHVIDAGEHAFITPGLIDAFGHLGFEGDRGATSPELSPANLVGAADESIRRVAHSGVTTVLVSPYSFDGSGSQLAAVKTAGEDRASRVVSPTAAVAFDVRGADPETIGGRLNGRIDAAKKYLEKWTKWEKDLAEWEKKKAEGTLEEAKPQTQEVVVEDKKEDPVTGTWSVRVFGGPLPQEFEGTVAFRLSGNKVEGRITDPPVPVEVRIIGTLSGTKITGVVEVDTGGQGTPTWEAELEPDLMRGTITVQMLSVNFEARRTDKTAQEFKVQRTRRRTTGKDGRPLPPEVDESLDPLRAVLEKKIPALVAVSTAAEIDRVLDSLVDEHQLSVVLLDAGSAWQHATRLKEKNVGVIAPSEVVRWDRERWYHQADDLSRSGVSVAFQSDAEDGARLLPRVGLFAVERGMGAEDALAALTINAAKMYRLEGRVGAIAPGCDGDLVIFSGHPFDTDSNILRVIINGQEVQP